MAMTLKSPVFKQNGHIPSKYTCEGEDVSPPLAWEGVPDDAKSLVLIIDDPDAPDPKAPKMVWVHWVVYNIPSDTRSLPENAGKARLPQGHVLANAELTRIRRVIGSHGYAGMVIGFSAHNSPPRSHLSHAVAYNLMAVSTASRTI